MVLVEEVSKKIFSGVFWRRFRVYKFGLKLRDKRVLYLTFRSVFVRLKDGSVWVSTPGGPITPEVLSEINDLGKISHVVAPGTYQSSYYIRAWKAIFPEMKSYVCPGAEKLYPDFKFDQELNTKGPNTEWGNEIDQLYFNGSRASEFAFFHKQSKTLMLSNLVQHYTDASFVDNDSLSKPLELYIRAMNAWGKPQMSPYFRFTLGKPFKDMAETKEKMEKIIYDWQPQGLVICRGENIWGKEKVKSVLEQCWKPTLKK